MHRPSTRFPHGQVSAVPDRGQAGSRTAVIAADLRRRIAEGDFPAGVRLPSEAALGTEYGTTRSVIRGARARGGAFRLGRLRPAPPKSDGSTLAVERPA